MIILLFKQTKKPINFEIHIFQNHKSQNISEIRQTHTRALQTFQTHKSALRRWSLKFYMANIGNICQQILTLRLSLIGDKYPAERGRDLWDSLDQVSMTSAFLSH